MSPTTHSSKSDCSDTLAAVYGNAYRHLNTSLDALSALPFFGNHDHKKCRHWDLIDAKDCLTSRLYAAESLFIVGAGYSKVSRSLLERETYKQDKRYAVLLRQATATSNISVAYSEEEQNEDYVSKCIEAYSNLELAFKANGDAAAMDASSRLRQSAVLAPALRQIVKSLEDDAIHLGNEHAVKAKELANENFSSAPKDVRGNVMKVFDTTNDLGDNRSSVDLIRTVRRQRELLSENTTCKGSRSRQKKSKVADSLERQIKALQELWVYSSAASADTVSRWSKVVVKCGKSSDFWPLLEPLQSMSHPYSATDQQEEEKTRIETLKSLADIAQAFNEAGRTNSGGRATAYRDSKLASWALTEIRRELEEESGRSIPLKASDEANVGALGEQTTEAAGSSQG